MNNPSGFCPLACVDASSVDTWSVSAGPRADLAAEQIWYSHRLVIKRIVNAPLTTKWRSINPMAAVIPMEKVIENYWRLMSSLWLVRNHFVVLYFCETFELKQIISLGYFCTSGDFSNKPTAREARLPLKLKEWNGQIYTSVLTFHWLKMC
jgi:hypothetical protein